MASQVARARVEIKALTQDENRLAAAVNAIVAAGRVPFFDRPEVAGCFADLIPSIARKAAGSERDLR